MIYILCYALRRALHTLNHTDAKAWVVCRNVWLLFEGLFIPISDSHRHNDKSNYTNQWCPENDSPI